MCVWVRAHWRLSSRFDSVRKKTILSYVNNNVCVCSFKGPWAQIHFSKKINSEVFALEFEESEESQHAKHMYSIFIAMNISTA